MSTGSAEQARNARLAYRIESGLAPLTPAILSTLRAQAEANLDVPGPRALQVLDELERVRAAVRTLVAFANETP